MFFATAYLTVQCHDRLHEYEPIIEGPQVASPLRELPDPLDPEDPRNYR